MIGREVVLHIWAWNAFWRIFLEGSVTMWGREKRSFALKMILIDNTGKFGLLVPMIMKGRIVMDKYYVLQ